MKEVARLYPTHPQGGERAIGTPEICADLGRGVMRGLDMLAHRSLPAPYLARRARIVLARAKDRDEIPTDVANDRLHGTRPLLLELLPRTV